MSVTDYAIIAIIGLLSAIGQYLLKVGLGGAVNDPVASSPIGVLGHAVTNPYFLLAGVLYVVAFGVYMLVLAKSDVSQIFPAAIGANVLCVAIMAAVVLGESVTAARLVGMAAIVAGVYIVTRF